MPHTRLLSWLILPLVLSGFTALAAAAETGSTGEAGETVAATTAEDAASEEETAEGGGPPVFTEEFLADASQISSGEEIWKEQCTHCHGAKAYPGKAPKLKPRRYDADFVYDRIHNGFRKMPAWKDVYSKDEIMAVTAYVLSDKFSP